MRSVFLLLVLTAQFLTGLFAQGLEGVVLEEYFPNSSVDRSVGLPDGLKTYRIYIDLQEGYELQVVYGSNGHRLWLGTSTTFYNDTAMGSTTGDRIRGGELGVGTTAIDSWITIRSASEIHAGVPRDLDDDFSSIMGSISDPTKSSMQMQNEGWPQETLLTIGEPDGLIKGDPVEVTTFGLGLGVFDNKPNSRLTTNNGAWASLGGAKGAGPENHVLIAQLTTDGEIYFALNVQVEGPDGETYKFVYSDPKEGEILFEDLMFALPEEHWSLN